MPHFVRSSFCHVRAFQLTYTSKIQHPWTYVAFFYFIFYANGRIMQQKLSALLASLLYSIFESTLSLSLAKWLPFLFGLSAFSADIRPHNFVRRDDDIVLFTLHAARNAKNALRHRNVPNNANKLRPKSRLANRENCSNDIDCRRLFMVIL